MSATRHATKTAAVAHFPVGIKCVDLPSTVRVVAKLQKINSLCVGTVANIVVSDGLILAPERSPCENAHPDFAGSARLTAAIFAGLALPLRIWRETWRVNEFF